MEQRIDALEKRLARFRGGKGPDDESASEGASVVAPAPPSPPLINHEISSKIAAFQTEIRRLEQVPTTCTSNLVLSIKFANNSRLCRIKN